MKGKNYRRSVLIGGVVLALVVAVAVSFGGPTQNQELPKIASGDPPEPMIHPPRIVGSTPGKPFLFRIPATGEGPLRFSASDLPAGLALDPETGIITGSLKAEGTFVAKLTVTGQQGTANRNLVIVAGKHKLALTPPLGWNSWNVWGTSVGDEKVRAAAEAMVKSGLAAHGFQYLNIDDGWMTGDEHGTKFPIMLWKNLSRTWKRSRGPNGEFQPNEKFPDLKALSDYVHGRGLKLGIYTSPGPKTCGLFEGSEGHEARDAATFAAWGIDYLKYDLCSYGFEHLAVTKRSNVKPYRKMGDLLAQADRDIVFSICQYGLGKVWTWGEEVGGNLWRVSGDVQDIWIGKKHFPVGITHGFDEGEISKFAGPGHWNDPDMLVVGKVGWGPNLHQSRLTPDEQITHITLWTMLAAPLMIGCNMAELDPFTLALLTNHDVLEVDQDPLGRAATRKAKTGETEVWSRPLWDGTLAVALFNRGEAPTEVTAKWSDLGRSGSQPVRNLWQRKELGAFDGSFAAEVAPHGAVLLKVGEPLKEDFNPRD